jgi:hypothetical protein
MIKYMHKYYYLLIYMKCDTYLFIQINHAKFS